MGALAKTHYERRLAAIMFTELADQSALVRLDEERALRGVADHARIVRACVADRGGKIVKATGSGYLIEFTSVMQAVDCGLDILRAHRDAAREEGRTRLRIGVHVGEILDHANDIYGDGVNIAARIQAVAPLDSVALSRQVYDQVRNKLNCAATELGRLPLKNISTPVYGYAVVPDGAPAPALPRPGLVAGLRARTLSRAPALAIGIGIAVAVAVAVAAGLANPAWRPRWFRAHPSAQRIAVLPFTQLSRDAGDEFLAEGLAEELTTRLTRVAGLKVLARSSAAKLKDRDLSLEQIAAITHAGLVLEGSLRRAGGALRVAVKLVDTASEEIRWAEEFDTSAVGVLRLEQRVADGVVAHLKLSPLPQASAAAADPEAPENRAELLYLKGKHAMANRDRDGLLAAIDLYGRALEARPDFAYAYVGLAHAYELLAYYGYLSSEIAMREHLKYVTHALRLAPVNAEAHLALAENLAYFKLDWKAAEAEYRRAIELDPENAMAHHWFADFLDARERFPEAYAEADEALALDPDSPSVNLITGTVRLDNGDYAGAIERFRRQLVVDPTFTAARTRLGTALIHAGRPDEAVRVLREAPRSAPLTSPEYRATLIHALVASGKRAEAERLDRELAESARTGFVPAYALAHARLALGDADDALRLLRQAIDEKSEHVAYLKKDPDFAPLRSRPEFGDLLRRLRLL